MKRCHDILKTFSMIAVCSLIPLGAHAQGVTAVTGAGASFPAPVYAKWADTYHKETGVRINYQSIGSSAGIKQIKAKTVDFGASDAPLPDAGLKQAGLLQFPTVIGGVVPIVNIKGIEPGQLRLSGALLADIYLGKIKRWNDAAVAALNPSLTLPDAEISVIRRADGSGTSYAFTEYLSKVSPDWKERVGAGAAVKWPLGAGGKGNEGIAAFVMRLKNSIGYVEYSYAKQNKMSHISLQNAAGHFVQPNESAFQAAAAEIDWRTSFAQSLTNTHGEAAWPISTATFILVPVQPDKPAQVEATLKFFDWAFHHGDVTASELDYVAFPDSVKEIIRTAWEQVKGADGKPLAYR